MPFSQWRTSRSKLRLYRLLQAAAVIVGCVLVVLAYTFCHTFIRQALGSWYVNTQSKQTFIDTCPLPETPKLPSAHTIYNEHVYDNCMTANSGSCQKGLPFDEELIRKYGLDTIHQTMTPLQGVSLEMFKASTIIVTGASSNHFEESISFLFTLQKHLKCFHVVYWDLGLNFLQVRELRKICGVQIRTFEPELYPPHVKILTTYAWKALIILEMLKSYSGVIWFDSSIRILDPYLFEKTYKAMIRSGGVLQFSHGHAWPYNFTHPRMFDYLPTNTYKLIRSSALGEGNSIAFYKTPKAVKNVLHWWWLCALTEDCISPPNSSIFRDLKDKHVHRFDQSALAILNENLFNFSTDIYMNQIIHVDREEYILARNISWCV